MREFEENAFSLIIFAYLLDSRSKDRIYIAEESKLENLPDACTRQITIHCANIHDIDQRRSHVAKKLYSAFVPFSFFVTNHTRSA